MTNTKFVAKHALILFLIAFLCSLILILCNNLTKDRIAKLQEQTELAAQSEVLPEAKTFEKANEAMLISDGTVREVLAGKDADGKEAGYCVKVEPSGFGGTISMTVGIGNDFTVKGVGCKDRQRLGQSDKRNKRCNHNIKGSDRRSQLGAFCRKNSIESEGGQK